GRDIKGAQKLNTLDNRALHRRTIGQFQSHDYKIPRVPLITICTSNALTLPSPVTSVRIGVRTPNAPLITSCTSNELTLPSMFTSPCTGVGTGIAVASSGFEP